MSTYLLRVGLGYRVNSILDNKRVEELCRSNGDLGRVGGRFKLWLTNDPHTAQFGEATIRPLLSKIEDTQGEIHDVVQEVIKPRKKLAALMAAASCLNLPATSSNTGAPK